MENPNIMGGLIVLITFGLMEIYCRFMGLLPFREVRKKYRGVGSAEQVASLADIFNEAKKYVCVVEGECRHIVWDNDGVISAIERAIARRIKILIYTGPWFDAESRRLAKLIDSGKVIFYLADAREGQHHYTVNDIGTVSYHAGSDGGMEVFFNGGRAFGIVFKQEFEKSIRRASPTGPGNFMERLKDGSQPGGYRLTFPLVYRSANRAEVAEFERYLKG